MSLAVKFKVRILLVLFTQVINKRLRMKGSINLGSLTDASTLRAGKMPAQDKK